MPQERIVDVEQALLEQGYRPAAGPIFGAMVRVIVEDLFDNPSRSLIATEDDFQAAVSAMNVAAAVPDILAGPGGLLHAAPPRMGEAFSIGTLDDVVIEATGGDILTMDPQLRKPLGGGLGTPTLRTTASLGAGGAQLAAAYRSSAPGAATVIFRPGSRTAQLLGAGLILS